jgi:hypothetical protein
MSLFFYDMKESASFTVRNGNPSKHPRFLIKSLAFTYMIAKMLALRDDSRSHQMRNGLQVFAACPLDGESESIAFGIMREYGNWRK